MKRSLLLLILPTLLMGCYHYPASYHQIQADDLFEQKRYQEASKEFSKAIRKAEDPSLALYNRAYCYYYLNKQEKALADINKHLSVSEKTKPNIWLKGLIYLKMERFEEASTCFADGLRFDPEGSNLWSTYGYAQSRAGKLEEARKSLNYAIELDSNNAVAFNNLSYVYLKQKELGKAEEMINKSLEMYPANAFAYRNLGLVLLESGDKPGACRAWKRAEHLGYSKSWGEDLQGLMKLHCGS